MQEAPYSVTVKTPKGNLVTVRGGTADEWVANLNSAASSGALGVISTIEATLAGSATGNAGASNSAATSSHPSNSGSADYNSQGQGSLNPPCERCGGPTEEKSGTSSRGPWRGYFCKNSTKEDKHPVKWA